MYLCLNCNHVFHEPQKYRASHGLDTPPFEDWQGCPKCAGSYVDATLCHICGEYITDDYAVLATGEKVCDRCYSIKNIGGWL